MSAGTDLVLVGDGIREWVARETALKLLETASLRVRTYGLEEFLHGPQISVGKGTRVVAFSAPGEPRWADARRYLKTVGVPLTEASSADWLAQILWGQRLAVAACRGLGVSPDTLRSDEPAYARALAALSGK
ncbi:MAG: hypothetical protein M0D55_04720 [Elusimicrobiota bacterium]|nr:MAG: hypothetical protein M0D55_04720 [Elusimicrobiota bacterium]